MENFKFTEEEYNALFNENTTVKDFKMLQDKAMKRFSYIIVTSSKIIGKKIDWYDFDNEYTNNRGFFDPVEYSEDIGFVGSFEKSNEFNQYEYYIPTVWLKNDFEEELKKEVEAFFKKEEKEKIALMNEKEANNKKAIKMANKIFSKLDDDEKEFITSKSFAKFQEKFRQEIAKIKKELKIKERLEFKSKSPEEKAAYYKMKH